MAIADASPDPYGAQIIRAEYTDGTLVGFIQSGLVNGGYNIGPNAVSALKVTRPLPGVQPAALGIYPETQTPGFPVVASSESKRVTVYPLNTG